MYQRHRRTKIVATTGPATETEARLEALLRAGVDIVRINFSHGTHEGHGRTIAIVRQTAQRLGRPIGVLQDLQGAKIRTGRLLNGLPVVLQEGATITITTEPVEGTGQVISTNYQGLPRDVQRHTRILLSDGAIELEVLEAGSSDVTARVVKGGVLAENQGINLPGTKVSAPPLTAKDIADLEFGLANGIDYVALSFVRRPDDIRQLKDFIRRRGRDVPVIAKLEKSEAIDNLSAILDVSDGVMVARGDMGVEMPLERVPIVQKQIIAQANQRNKAVITATQMLESMLHNPYPTRAEASDVANAILDGTDAVMLSGETAVGEYPVEAVRTMARIAEETERGAPTFAIRKESAAPMMTQNVSYPHAIGHAATVLANELNVTAIVAFTRSGYTARILSQQRPRVPVFALTPSETVYRALTLWWGVFPILCPFRENTDVMIDDTEALLLERDLISPGDSFIVVGRSPVMGRGRTNFIKVHQTRRRRRTAAETA